MSANDQTDSNSIAQSNSNNNNNIRIIKQRIIKTDKLMTVLKKFKQDGKIQLDKIDSLEQKLQEAEKKFEKNESEKIDSEQTVSKQTPPSGGLQVIIDNLQKRLSEAEASKAASQKALESKNVYIEQLEALNEKLKDDANVNKVPKTSDKHRQEITEKNKTISSLENVVKKLEAEVDSLQAKYDKLDDDFMTLQVEADLAADQEESKALKSKLDQLDNEQVRAKSQIQQLKSQLSRANDEKQNLKKLLEQNTKRAEMNKNNNFDKANYDKSRQELAHVKELLEKSQANNTMSQEKLDILQKAHRNLQSENSKLKIDRDELRQHVDDLARSKPNDPSTAAFPRRETTDINSDFVTKFRNMKTDYNMFKNENRFLKERVRKLTLKISKNQDLDDLLKSSSSDEEIFDKSDSHSEISKPKRHYSVTSNEPDNVLPHTVEPIPVSSGQPPKLAASSITVARTRNVAHDKQTSQETSTLPRKDLATSPVRPTLTTKQPSQTRQTSDLSPTSPVQKPSTRRVSAPKLFIPQPKQAAVPKNKKKDNRLTKFVNSRNPSKVIDSRPIISPLHDRPSTTEERTAKRTKLDMRYASMIEDWINQKKLATLADVDVDNIINEIGINYKVMKSLNNPDPKGVIKFGIEGVYQLDVPDKWDAREKGYAWILCFHSSKNTKAYHDICKRLSEELVQCLKVKRLDASSSRYCRLLSLLCKSRNDIERVRTLCYDIIRHSTCNNNTFACLYNIVCGWEDCLIMNDESSLLLKAIQSCLAHIFNKSDIPENVKVMYTEITRRCNWSEISQIPTTDAVIGKVMDQLLALEGVPVTIAFDRLRFEIVKSFELIFHVLGDWKKMYNEFILVKLWPLLTRDVVDDLALETMAILGTFGLSQDPFKEDQPGVQYLFDIMVQVASVDVAADDERDIQLTAIKGAWMLGAHDPTRVAKIRQCVESINNAL